MKKTLTQNFYRPNVKLGGSDYVFGLGEYTLRLYSSQFYRTGLIEYLYILKVTNSLDEEVLYVAAEVNPVERNKLYLGCFTANGHSTLYDSGLLAALEFFFPIACRIVRDRLNLPLLNYPITVEEKMSIARACTLIDETCAGMSESDRTAFINLDAQEELRYMQELR